MHYSYIQVIMRTFVFLMFTLQIFTSTFANCISDTTSGTELYDNVNEALYDEAVAQIKTLQSEGKSSVIYETVFKLLDGNVGNIIHYAYKLWIAGEKRIVIEYFPRAFKLIFNEDDVRITNSKYKLQLKLDVNAESDGDRRAWGDGTNAETRRLLWRFEPAWEHNRVYFKIKNLERNMFLKLNYSPDNIGDRHVWGDNLKVANNRLIWALDPVWKDKELSFRIVNQEFGLPLKLAVSTDSYKDRKAWGHNGGFGDDGKRFEWIIEDKDKNLDVSIYKQIISLRMANDVL